MFSPFAANMLSPNILHGKAGNQRDEDIQKSSNPSFLPA
jgi:hypothetical protein